MDVKRLSLKENCTDKISSEEWLNYFSMLLGNATFDSDPVFKETINNMLCEHDFYCDKCNSNQLINENISNNLNKDISEQEVNNALKEMKNGKAPGPDGLPIEFLKHLTKVLSPALLVDLFNCIYKKCTFPDQWCNAIIFPLYKGKGGAVDPNNYRGISLLDTCGKVFTKILNRRLQEFVLEHGKLYEQQAGYQKGYRTTDQIFILQAVVQKYLDKPKGRMYCGYIDFSKAFDCVQHKFLWCILIKEGIMVTF